MTRMSVFLLALFISASAIGDEAQPVYQLSYEIERAGKPVASPVVLVRAGQTSRILVGEAGIPWLELEFTASPRADRVRVTTALTFDGAEHQWEGTLELASQTMFKFDDVLVRVKAETYEAGAARQSLRQTYDAAAASAALTPN